MKVITGVIDGNTIKLNDQPGFADGAVVEVVIRPSSQSRIAGEGFLRTEGALADDTEWDAIMEEVQAMRRKERSGIGDLP